MSPSGPQENVRRRQGRRRQQHRRCPPRSAARPRRPTVRLTANDATSVEDLAAILGAPPPNPGDVIDVAPGLTLADHCDADCHNVVDAGTDSFTDHQGAVYVVLRNDYLSLRRALNVPRTTVGLILLTEHTRSLRTRDVAEVLNPPIVAELAVEPAIARAVDAGVLSIRRRLPVDLDLPAFPAR